MSSARVTVAATVQRLTVHVKGELKIVADVRAASKLVCIVDGFIRATITHYNSMRTALTNQIT